MLPGRSAPAASRHGPRSCRLWPHLQCRPVGSAAKHKTAAVEESVPGCAASGSGGQPREGGVRRLAELIARELGQRLTQSSSRTPYAETEADAEVEAGAGPPRGPRQAPGPLPPDPRLLARLEAVEARAAAAEAKAAAAEAKAGTLQQRVAAAEAEAQQARAEAARATKAAQLARSAAGGGGGSSSGWRWLRRRRQEVEPAAAEPAGGGRGSWGQQLQEAWVTTDLPLRLALWFIIATFLTFAPLLPPLSAGAGWYAEVNLRLMLLFLAGIFNGLVLPRLLRLSP
ncbi:hypothetical protein HYH03_013350 [Edaphochlamys debaryana]|uniref:Uncharacterized protein n=1 Tax=Edaphochlamys debaryana TaxID=47281 RepID=A0A835XWD3_9CHLO|nr:hypothetical protein HYH03_013350 [Edaphochlamys debaryana]|eukprot:KAG2488045.1 hypothetical protein HYH03_013350 [Edaphochlamys debaryana]